jgi:hypothetical protein
MAAKVAQRPLPRSRRERRHGASGGPLPIRIVLDASDTYSIEIGRMKGRFDYVKHAEVSDVCAEDLVRIIDAEFSRAFGGI